MTLLRVEGVTKRYGGTVALDRVDFVAHAQSVNVLIGENGAGKSTLMRILAGVEKPSAGRVLLDDEPVSFDSVQAAAAAGIAIVHQELNFCPNLTVAENIFLDAGSETGKLMLNHGQERDAARALLRRLKHDIDPKTPMGELRIGQQQIVEIAKSLRKECRLLILDEPTSALSAAEVEVLFEVINELKRAGVAIVYISHRLEELLAIGDFITVLRDGRVVDHTKASKASLQWIVDRMLGEEGRIERSRPQESVAGPNVLEVRNLANSAALGAPMRDISISFRAGEITAIYGLLGSGRTAMMETICGSREAERGSVLLDGEPLDKLGIAERVERGILLVPEDRQRDGLFDNLSVGRNISLADLSSFLRFGSISVRSELASIRQMIAKLGIKTQSPAVPIQALSGGNQQKVIIGRSLMAKPRAILLDEPSRGVDVGARAEIFATMDRLAKEGLTVIFTTSDVLEARAIADRVIVLTNGRIEADVRASECDEQTLVAAANASGQKLEEMAELT